MGFQFDIEVVNNIEYLDCKNRGRHCSICVHRKKYKSNYWDKKQKWDKRENNNIITSYWR